MGSRVPFSSWHLSDAGVATLRGMELHPALDPIAGLIGTWDGDGTGDYPTIAPFSYHEELTFTDVGKPFLAYQQKTFAPDGRPMHVETGYLRVPTPQTVEFVLALPTGHTELAEGTLDVEGDVVVVRLTGAIVTSSTAKQVDRTVREYRLQGNALTTLFDMQAVGQPLQRHLESHLVRMS